MPDLELWSRDKQFGLHIAAPVLEAIIATCARSAGYEVGGVLVGYYTVTLDCAVVTVALGPTADSRAGSHWLVSGVRGLQSLLDRLWQRRHQYYLGEWHFHPGGRPTPSQADTRQMAAIVGSPSYHCPEPVLLIVGGDPPVLCEMRAFVFTHNRGSIELVVQHTDSDSQDLPSVKA